jgi:hypothetical protein
LIGWTRGSGSLPEITTCQYVSESLPRGFFVKLGRQFLCISLFVMSGKFKTGIIVFLGCGSVQSELFEQHSCTLLEGRMGAESSSITLVAVYQTTRRHIPEDRNVHIQRRKKLACHRNHLYSCYQKATHNAAKT